MSLRFSAATAALFVLGASPGAVHAQSMDTMPGMAMPGTDATTKTQTTQPAMDDMAMEDMPRRNTAG